MYATETTANLILIFQDPNTSKAVQGKVKIELNKRGISAETF